MFILDAQLFQALLGLFTMVVFSSYVCPWLFIVIENKIVIVCPVVSDSPPFLLDHILAVLDSPCLILLVSISDYGQKEERGRAFGSTVGRSSISTDRRYSGESILLVQCLDLCLELYLSVYEFG